MSKAGRRVMRIRRLLCKRGDMEHEGRSRRWMLRWQENFCGQKSVAVELEEPEGMQRVARYYRSV
jgi:hypothetical protein